MICRSCAIPRPEAELRVVCLNRCFHQVMCLRCIHDLRSRDHEILLQVLVDYQAVMGSPSRLQLCRCSLPTRALENE